MVKHVNWTSRREQNINWHDLNTKFPFFYVRFQGLVSFFCSTSLQVTQTFPNFRLSLKCTPVQALRLCTCRMADRGSRGIALPFHDHGTRRGWGVSVTPRPLFTPGRDPVPIVQAAGWAPVPVWDRCGKFRPKQGFDPRTVQPVASCYTDWAIRPNPT